MKRKRIVEVIGAGLLSLSLLTSCGVSDDIKQDMYCCYEITQGQLSEVEVASILGADTSYINCGFKNAEYVRTLVTAEKPIYLVPTEKFLSWNNYTLEDFTKHINEIFEIINPQIKFVYSKDMPEGEQNVILFDVEDSRDKFGTTYMKNYVKKGKEVYNFDCKIVISKDYWLKSFNMVSLTELTAHEIGHVLGLADIEETNTKTVMAPSGYNGIDALYSLNDMYLLATLYGGYETEEDVKQVKEKLDEYYESCKEKANENSSINKSNKNNKTSGKWYDKNNKYPNLNQNNPFGGTFEPIWQK